MEPGGGRPSMKTMEKRLEDAYENILYASDDTWSFEPNETREVCKRLYLLEQKNKAQLSKEQSNLQEPAMTSRQNPADERDMPSTSAQGRSDGGREDFLLRYRLEDNLEEPELPESPFLRVNSLAESILKLEITQQTVKAIWNDDPRNAIKMPFANYKPPPIEKKTKSLPQIISFGPRPEQVKEDFTFRDKKGRPSVHETCSRFEDGYEPPSCLIPVPNLLRGSVTYYVFGKKYRMQEMLELLRQQHLLNRLNLKANKENEIDELDNIDEALSIKSLDEDQDLGEDWESNKNFPLPKSHITKFTNKEQVTEEFEDLVRMVFDFVFIEPDDPVEEVIAPVQTASNRRASPRSKKSSFDIIPGVPPNRNHENNFDYFKREKIQKCSKKQKKEERWRMLEEQKRQKRQKKLNKKQQSVQIKRKLDSESISEASSFSSEKKTRRKLKPVIQPMEEVDEAIETAHLTRDRCNTVAALEEGRCPRWEIKNTESENTGSTQISPRKYRRGRRNFNIDVDINETTEEIAPINGNIRIGWSILFSFLCSFLCCFYLCYFAYRLLTINVFLE